MPDLNRRLIIRVLGHQVDGFHELDAARVSVSAYALPFELFGINRFGALAYLEGGERHLTFCCLVDIQLAEDEQVLSDWELPDSPTHWAELTGPTPIGQPI